MSKTHTKPKVEVVYSIKQATPGNILGVRYEVNKLVGPEASRVVDNTYDVHIGVDGVAECNCMAWRLKGDRDKHILMVRRWISSGKKPEVIIVP